MFDLRNHDPQKPTSSAPKPHSGLKPKADTQSPVTIASWAQLSFVNFAQNFKSLVEKTRIHGPDWLKQSIRSGWTGFLSFFKGLSGNLLIITAGFVFVVEILIIIPSLATFQERWLIDRVRAGEIASIALEASPKKTVKRDISDKLLKSFGARYLAIQSAKSPDIILRADDNRRGFDTIDLRQSHKTLAHDLAYVLGPWETLFGAKSRQLYVIAQPRLSQNDVIAIGVDAEPLRQDLMTYLLSILRWTISISFVFGAVLFLLLSYFIVRPMQRLTHSITRFKADPEDINASPKLSGRRDEIGEIEVELNQMQNEVRHALKSQSRLAALGQAVSKINHDLRNMLTSAQMASDRLASSGDPVVAKALPRLERALDRALSLAQNVLNYGKSDETPARIQIIRLKPLADAAAEDAGLALTATTAQGGVDKVRFTFKAVRGFTLEADPEHLHRLLVNLMRNAKQAIEAQPNRKSVGRVTLTALKTTEDVILVVADNGPRDC